MKQKTRRNRLKRFHQFYKPYDTAPNVCYYCGQPADTTDHVPPLWIVESYGISALADAGVKLYKLPCCSTCNVSLGQDEQMTPRSRGVWLYERTRKIYRRKYAGARWTQDELDELGPSLRTAMSHLEDVRSWMHARLQFMRRRFS